MISKLIAYDSTRELAINKLVKALRNYHVVGMPTNISFVEKCADHPAFREGGVTTGFLDIYADDVKVVLDQDRDMNVARGVAAFAKFLEDENRVEGKGGVGAEEEGHSNWSTKQGSWVLGADVVRPVNFDLEGADEGDEGVEGVDSSTATATATATATCHKDGAFTFDFGNNKMMVSGTISKSKKFVVKVNNRNIVGTYFVERGVNGEATVSLWAEPGQFFDGTESFASVKFKGRTLGEGSGMVGNGSVLAPMPGKITNFAVAEGEEVEEGAVVMTLEAMKMEHPIVAPKAGIVRNVGGVVGDLVSDGNLLFVVEDE